MKPCLHSGAILERVLAENIRLQRCAAEAVLELGGIPFIPHLAHTWEMVRPHPYEFWLEYDFIGSPCVTRSTEYLVNPRAQMARWKAERDGWAYLCSTPLRSWRGSLEV